MMTSDMNGFQLPGSSINNPAPVGVTVTTTVERGDAYLSPEIYNVRITVLEVVRGEEARKRISSQGVSDRPPETGFEYVLTSIRFGYYQRGQRQGKEIYKLTEGQFAAVSADGKQEYPLPSVLHQPQPPLIGRVFSHDESHDGWILLQVPVGEKEPRLVFKRKHTEGIYGIWGYVWFQLY
jgi:hypothetical protein